MRVIAGVARRTRLDAPGGRTVRPTMDRVRESVFNSLGSLDAIEGSSVLDLFAGSGALGIEALSRGARRCTFVERDRSSLDVVRANLERCRLADLATVVAADAFDHLIAEGAGFDLVLADPPYDFDRWPELLELLGPCVAVLESDRPVDAGPRADIISQRRHGSTVVTIARLSDRDEHGRGTPEERS